MKTTSQSNQFTPPTFNIPRYECIMLVDENSMDNFIHKRLIESAGFAGEVITFESSKEGLQFLTAGKNLPQIIFLDIHMPGMNGFEFLEAMMDLPETVKHHCRVIMLSTSESFKDLNKANKSPFVRKFLNKPLTIEVLSAIKV